MTDVASSVSPQSPEALRAFFLDARAASEALSAPLSPEDHGLQSMPDASPVKWHLAHTTWFWECFVLKPHAAGYQEYSSDYNYLFNSYYNAVGDRHPRPHRGLLSRPPLEDVRAYRRHVSAAMADFLSENGDDPEIEALTLLGVAHEQQHQELILTDLKHPLSMHPCAPAAYPDTGPVSVEPETVRWRSFEGGVHWCGAEEHAWAFDNETPRHRSYLEPFQLATRALTQGEVANFIADGGYTTPSLWLSDGWDWVQAHDMDAPLYWRREEDAWRTFTLHGEEALDRRAPAAHLSYFEADAIARWMDARLPDEREWEHAARIAIADGVRPDKGQFARPGHSSHPRGLGKLAPLPDTAQGPAVNGLFGGVWEWTRSAYAAYPGYAPGAGALGEYNGKFMNGQYVLRGGSCATPAGHMRASYRNFFPPHAQWQFSGVRLARDA